MGQRKSLLVLGVFAFAIAGLLRAVDDPVASIGVLLEPSFDTPEIYHEVQGANKTVLVPARITKYGGVDTFTEKEWNAEKLDWPAVLPKAMERAEKLNAATEIQWVRDERGALQYGLLQSEDSFLSSIIFCKGFLPRFETMLGKEVLAVVPDRHIIYVFPIQGTDFQKFGPALIAKHRDAKNPVSLEVFQVGKQGCRVVGIVNS